MNKYLNKVTEADNMEILKDLPDNSIDLMVTDPPYGLTQGKNPKGGFMGRAWDKAVPPTEVWKECLRVLKPGAFAFVMSIPRQDCLARMIVNLEDAGFVISFSSLYHAFAQGLPKPLSVSRVIDRRAKAERPIIGTTRSGGFAHIMTTNQQQGYRLNDYYEDTGNVMRSNEPITPEAKALEGCYTGFSPKPALEVILAAMVPLSEKTYTDQALKCLSEKTCVSCGYDEWGVGSETTRLDCGCYMCDECLLSGVAIEHEHKPHKTGLGCTWLDNCRIPRDDVLKTTGRTPRTEDNIFNDESCGFKKETNHIASADPKGRFPANLLVYDNCLDDGKIHSSGSNCVATKDSKFVDNAWGKKGQRQTTYGDSGSFSRFFSLDAWVEKTLPLLITPKASKSEKNLGLDHLPKRQMYKQDNSANSLEIFGTTDGGRQPRQNNHPTCKPVTLMQYLITMGSRKGDIVLDPYIGSGTTGVAALRLGRKFIGIDNDPNSCEIASARINHELMQPLMDF